MSLPLRPCHLRPLLRPLSRPHSTSATPRFPAPKSRLLRPTSILGFTLLLSASSYYYYTTTYPPRPPHLNPDYFHPYTLTALNPVSSSPQTSILTLTTPHAPPPGTMPADKVVSIEIKQPQLMIARSYTPIPVTGVEELELPVGEGDGRTIHLFIKREPGGEMSRYMLALQPGAEVQIRGPHEEWDLAAAKEAKKRVLFLAGGSGIAPALQAAEKVCKLDGKAEVRVLWGVWGRAETEGVMREVVGTLVERWKGRVKVEVREDSVKGGPGIQRKEVEEAVKKWASSVACSGPDGFVEYWVGGKRWVEGVETQGEVSGVVGEVRRRMGKAGEGVEVWKM